MSETQDTTTESDAHSHETDQSADADTDGDHVRDERGDAQRRREESTEEQREDHLLTVTFELDTEGEANHGFLRDREVPVEAIVQNELGRPLEEVLHDAKQQVKYDQQGQRGQQGQQRQQPGGQR